MCAKKAEMNERRKKVIAALNKARSMELYAIYQYMHQHYALDDQNYGPLAKNMKKIAIEEMKHAEHFAERIKELEGDPVTEREGSITRGQGVREIYAFDAGVEAETIGVYNDLYNVCAENDDVVSKAIFQEITNAEQEHFNYFDDTARHIKDLGDHFLARMASGASE